MAKGDSPDTTPTTSATCQRLAGFFRSVSIASKKVRAKRVREVVVGVVVGGVVGVVWSRSSRRIEQMRLPLQRFHPQHSRSSWLN